MPLALALSLSLALSATAAADPLEAGVSGSRQRAARAALPGLEWIGVFAEGRQYRVARDGAGLYLSGGAYVQLLRNVSLRGGYRIFDYDGTEGDSSWETDQHGVLLGLSLRF